MQFDFQTLDPRDRYKLLISVVVPRPIALVTTIDDHGRVNAAPFSFFNAIGSDPPLVVLGIGDRAPGVPKDTARNIHATNEFVVNLVDESLAQRMNTCAVDFPAGIDELQCAGLTPAVCIDVRPPRIAESPVNLECREHSTTDIGQNRIILGQILRLHIRDEFLDPQRIYVHTEKLHLIGRMHGGGWYSRTSDLFEMPRMNYQQWQSASKEGGAPSGGPQSRGDGA